MLTGAGVVPLVSADGAPGHLGAGRLALGILGLQNPWLDFKPSRHFTSFTFWCQHPYPGVARRAVDTTLATLDRMNSLVAENGGRSPGYQEAEGARVMAEPEINVRLHLGRGDAIATVWTCDFSYDYVKINAEYRT